MSYSTCEMEVVAVAIIAIAAAAAEQEKLFQCNFFGPPRDQFLESIAWRPEKTTLEKFFLLRGGAIAIAAVVASMAMMMSISISHVLYDMGFS